jgi:acrylyl-CoA reductase (NADPH)/3-hydroxypropionyl-CoA dehydratase/3-hydroxypropionyl-CoA synthetase
MEAICKNYINSYWATEHGGIAWSRRYNDDKQVLKADTHSWPLPWLDADIYAYDESSRPTDENAGVWKATQADVGERAEVVLTAPYPYMFRYVWGDVENFGKPGWAGDRATMTKKYWRKTQLANAGENWVYVQGDFAVKYPDGAFTFHGRSDEVLNVNGILFGTEHIEGAILRDRQKNSDSPVGHCVVVGLPDRVAGEVPIAFVVPGQPGRSLTSEDFMRLFGLVNETVGAVQVKFVTVSALPQTFSGKFMRRLLKSIASGEPLGDTSTISNPDCIARIKAEFAEWQAQQTN